MLAFGLRGVAGRGLVFVIRALWNGYLRGDGWQIWLRFEADGFIASAGLLVMRAGDFAGRGSTWLVAFLCRLLLRLPGR